MSRVARGEWPGIEAEVREGGRLDPDLLRKEAQALRRQELGRLLASAAAALAEARRLLGERLSGRGAEAAGRAAGRRA